MRICSVIVYQGIAAPQVGYTGFGALFCACFFDNECYLIYKFDIMEKNVNDAKKQPYNLREKKVKTAAYRNQISPALADVLYDKIMDLIVIQKKYRDPHYSAKDMAKELETNTRYLSAVINSRFGLNLSELKNKYRITEALHLLTDKRYKNMNIEEISVMVGFANRQSFYSAFYKNVGVTPNDYRKRVSE